MKYDIRNVLLFIFLLIPLSLSSTDDVAPLNDEEYSKFVKKQELLKQVEINKEFKLALAKRESSLRPHVINDIGAMGLWQFLPSTLRDLGYNITPTKFRKNPNIFPADVQEEILEKKFYEDYKVLTKQWFRVESTNVNYIEKYVGKKFLGVDITLSGLLAACHIGGVGGTMRFLDSQGTHNPCDLYGTSIYSYLKEFSGYDYVLDIPIKKEIKCLEKQLIFGDLLTLSSEQSKLSYLIQSLRDTETVLTSRHLAASNRSGVESIQYAKLSLSDSKPNYRNIIEEFLYLGAAQQSSITSSLETVTERLSGIMPKSGKALYRQMPDLIRYLSVQGSFNSTLSRYGMHLGTLRLSTCFRYIGLRKLRYFPHLGEG